MPSKFKFILVQYIQFFALFVILRAVFYFAFFNASDILHSSEIQKALYLGIKFDFKLASLCIIPFAILSTFFFKKLAKNNVVKTTTTIVLTTLYTILLIFYILDFGNYDYLATRVDSTVLRFFDDMAISYQMMIESYPVVWATIGVLLFITITYLLLRFEIRKTTLNNTVKSKNRNIVFYTLTCLIISGGIYGNIAYFPLRWSQAMFSKDKSINSLALNPVLYFFDSFKFRTTNFNIENTKSTYNEVASFLNFDNPDSIKLSYTRSYAEENREKPNIVIVLLESFGASQLGTFGNPMHPTPCVDSIIKESVLFNNFYVPAMGTARSVWACLTGIPDVETASTASRNPFAIDQKLIFDAFTDYNKYYIIGGNANWANIRALFKNNIKDLQIFEEGAYDGDLSNKKTDVWGLDDYTLFNNADIIFDKSTKEKKPFIAFLQSASNHRPYTIGDHDGSFTVKTESDIDMKTLSEAGFLDIDQYNALRYMDYNIGHLIKLAKESDYYKNTIFMFFGDHNARTNEYNHCKFDEFAIGLNYLHVPLIVHSPNNLKPKVDSLPASLIDVFATAAKFAGIKHTNYSLGVDLLDTTIKDRVAFVVPFKEEKSIGLIKNNIYIEKNLLNNTTYVYDLHSNDVTKNLNINNTQEWNSYKSLLEGMYQSSLYLMYNNKKENK